jgi:adenosylcobyric acid synthase
MKGIMIQGTSSDAGKSFITTVFCRLLANEGIKVAPFKSQNMSNNSYITVDGYEIGRAQGIQAEAANTEASPWMNPILLKPTSDQSSEIVLFGKSIQTLSGMSYREQFYDKGLEAIKLGLSKLAEDYDVVVIEGAGSPVEVNLKDRELVNMKVAELADVPVILVSDIERGGIFASIVGTLELLTPSERNRVKGILINKFRGDSRLFQDGVAWLEERTGIPVLGVIPYVDNHMIESEDSLSLMARFGHVKGKDLDIAVIKFPYISNYTDLEPFLAEDDVSIRWIQRGDSLGNPDAVIIPGTKSTIHDLRFVKESGLASEIRHYFQNGGRIVGICGGFQMLCEEMIDPYGTDTGIPDSVEYGLSLIPAKTIFAAEKKTVRSKGSLLNSIDSSAMAVEGYEIHLGNTVMKQGKEQQPLLRLDNGEFEGHCSDGGRLIGTYIHDLFHNDGWRTFWLNLIRKQKQRPLRQVSSFNEQRKFRFDTAVKSVLPFIQWEKIKGIIGDWSKGS